ncbi:MAG: methylenetetrahydrofolate--tRNA-(uracil(54)-C(5))-methyltransferase (FADH(2)-oxidizing) TrmFO, partial [Anaerolineae bacterium]|nr:methylenetetrahydrofolate--tRNA-(uracil(54)-C(5))-methyltransferase (FADH(2)-oxidizing) TrmFO [Anaerolineae bacterium]
MRQVVTVVGGGLAGSEAAWQLAERGHQVRLFEMRPANTTGAHVSDRLAELVCSNSLGSKLPDRATGILQNETRMLGSLLMRCAQDAAVPAGGALAVDRERFAESVTERLGAHPGIEIRREEVTALELDQPTIVASGPLTSPTLSRAIGQLTGEDYLYFYDAISPIVQAASIDMSRAFQANRYGRGEDAAGDYINCPMDKPEYDRFVTALASAETIELRDFEREDPNFFEGCVPIEQLARRGHDTLAFGPMRPVGLRDPHTGRRPHAVVQLRQDDVAGDLNNVVGFQTNIRWKQQREILRMIPGLEAAEFVRMGQMHRNTFLNAPALLHP